jgi:hypothetical protein
MYMFIILLLMNYSSTLRDLLGLNLLNNLTINCLNNSWLVSACITKLSLIKITFNYLKRLVHNLGSRRVLTLVPSLDIMAWSTHTIFLFCILSLLLDLLLILILLLLPYSSRGLLRSHIGISWLALLHLMVFFFVDCILGMIMVSLILLSMSTILWMLNLYLLAWIVYYSLVLVNWFLGSWNSLNLPLRNWSISMLGLINIVTLRSILNRLLNWLLLHLNILLSLWIIDDLDLLCGHWALFTLHSNISTLIYNLTRICAGGYHTV